MILFGGYLPDRVASVLKRESHYRRKKIELNERLILEFVRELRSRQLDFVFLVFHAHRVTNHLFYGSDWREAFLKRLFKENAVPYIWSKQLAVEDGGVSPELYLDPAHRHPTEHFNRVIAEHIKHRVLGRTGGADRGAG